VDKKQFEPIVTTLLAAWNFKVSPENLQEFKRGWYHFLGDLDVKDVVAAVDALAMRDSPYPPRPGDVRRLAIDIADPSGKMPSGEEAWFEMRNLAEAAFSGLPYGAASPVLKALFETVGESVLGLTTNADRQVFMDLYEKAAEKLTQERYGIPAE
jgi:hypothetical protein